MLGQESKILIGVALAWVLGEAGCRIWARRDEKYGALNALPGQQN